MKSYNEWAKLFNAEIKKLLPSDYLMSELLSGMGRITDSVDEAVNAFSLFQEWPPLERLERFELVARLAFAEWHCREFQTPSDVVASRDSAAFLDELLNTYYRGGGRLEWLRDVWHIAAREDGM